MERILVDTCILISAYRGNKDISNVLKKFHHKLVISPITIMELYRGLKTREKKRELKKQLKSYSIIHINKDVTEKAIGILKKYQSNKRNIFIPDCLIAATCILYDYQLFTENKSDFEFIENIRFFKL
ncbi:MAG: type II toxin-antitoxin system VapC family toxin [Leptospiraceae bacterium]|nr:type II toxin-antitoxin system VapC family toxin [Leptospiraceae bacterium]